MDAAGSQAHLADLEAAALAQQDVRGGHAAVLEAQVHVAARRVIVAEHVHRPQDFQARRADRHQDLRLLNCGDASGLVLTMVMAKGS